MSLLNPLPQVVKVLCISSLLFLSIQKTEKKTWSHSTADSQGGSEVVSHLGPKNDLTLLQLLKPPINLHIDLEQINKTYIMLYVLFSKTVPSVIKHAGMNLQLVFVGLSLD